MQAAVRAIRSRPIAAKAAPFRRARFWIICLFFLLWAGAIAGRLFWLQIVRHQEYVERAQRQQERTFEVAPRRGILYDRNLHELAMTVLADSIYADPSQIQNKPAAARALAALVHTDPKDTRTTARAIAARLKAGREFAWIARRVSPAVATRVRAFIKKRDFKGIYFQKEFKRYYPNNDLAAQVLGYVGSDDNGLGGLEAEFNPQLHGVPGRMYMAIDARRRVLGSSERDPQPGRNLALSIDENIQYMAERALNHAMEKTHALDGTVVVQDVHTGQILALAIRPTFNPNDSRFTKPNLLRDRAVSDVYEPGSVFKLVTYSAALQEKLITPDTMINCQGGQITLAGRVIHDDQSDRGLGTVPVTTALARSSDVAAIKVALKVGPARFYHFIRAFGFGQRTDIELPGETRGLLRPVSLWRPATIGYIAIGQGVAVTPLQLVTMVSTIANGGVYLPPRVLLPDQLKPTRQPELHAEPVKDGEELPNPLPPGAHRVISTYTAAEMRELMQDVVLDGTGKNAQLNGYSSAGKTGTAQKIDPRTHLYSKTMHIASFAGFAPVNDPVISVAVVIDSPKGAYYGAEVSAPVFAEVAQEVLEYLGVPHDIPLSQPSDSSRHESVIAEDTAAENPANINALYAAANALPSDDPQSTAASQQETSDAAARQASAQARNPAGSPQSASPAAYRSAALTRPASSKPETPATQPPAKVTMAAPAKLRVPKLIGLSMRKAIEKTGDAGLEVQIVGSGLVREQVPAPGTMVPQGTKIVVRCSR